MRLPLLRQRLRRQLRRLAMKIPVFTVRPYVEKLGGRALRQLHASWGRGSAFAEVDERAILGFIFRADKPAPVAATKAAPALRRAPAFDGEAMPLPPAAEHELPVGFVGPIAGLSATPSMVCA